MSHTIEIYATSTEPVVVPISAEQNGVPYDPTQDVVEFAVIDISKVAPASGDWKPALWETDMSASAPQYRVVGMVGPGGNVQLAPGTYNVFARIHDNPAVPVKQALGRLKVL